MKQATHTPSPAPTPTRFDIPEYLVRRETARRGQRIVQVAAVAIAVTCFAAASVFVAPLDSIRLEKQLALDPESTKGLPPEISLLTKTGTFRALAIDFLFMRLEDLKQADKFYELNKLSEIIVKLAPRFPSVWKYAAWNMAYNVSVAQYSPDGRWYWVRKGIDLLRNQGLRYNEKSIGLYLELAWTFWHKVGDFLDDYHWIYKKELAVEMERVLGAPPPLTTEQEVIDNFAAIANAPRTLEELFKDDPEAAAFAERLPGVGLAADKSLLEFVARYVRSELQAYDVLKDVTEDTTRTPHEARVELITNPKTAAACDRLLACLRSIMLRDDYNMDPAWMLQLMQDYGPLDWRSPYSHALYWSTRGNMITKGQISLDENDSMNCVRYIFFGLALTIKRGRIVLEPDFDDPKRSYLELLPDTRFIDHLHHAYLMLGKEQFGGDPRYVEGTAGPNYHAGHVSFLEDGIRQLYIEGGPKNVEIARKHYEYLRKYNPDPDGKVQSRYLVPLEQFVMADIRQDLDSFKRANAMIGGWLMRSLKDLSLGDVDQSRAAIEWGRKCWMIYMEDKRLEPGQTERRALAPLADMLADSVVQFVQRPEFHILHKSRMWHRLDESMQRITYDELVPYFKELCERNDPPFDPARAFPEPPGMEEFRKTHDRRKDIDTSINRGEKGNS